VAAHLRGVLWHQVGERKRDVADPLDVEHELRTGRRVAQLRAPVRERFRRHRRAADRGDFDAGFAHAAAVVRGPRRSLWAGRAKGWVGPAELAELNALTVRIYDILRAPRRAGAKQLVSWCHVLAPIVDRPARR
jgi:hypothetical protein